MDRCWSIDEVRERSGTLQQLTEDIRAVREEVVAVGDRFDAKVRSFGEVFPRAAEAVIAENIQADPSFVDAVEAAAATIVEKQAAGSLAIESEPGGGTAISARVPAIAAGPAGVTTR